MSDRYRVGDALIGRISIHTTGRPLVNDVIEWMDDIVEDVQYKVFGEDDSLAFTQWTNVLHDYLGALERSDCATVSIRRVLTGEYTNDDERRLHNVLLLARQRIPENVAFRVVGCSGFFVWPSL